LGKPKLVLVLLGVQLLLAIIVIILVGVDSEVCIKAATRTTEADRDQNRFAGSRKFDYGDPYRDCVDGGNIADVFRSAPYLPTVAAGPAFTFITGFVSIVVFAGHAIFLLLMSPVDIINWFLWGLMSMLWFICAVLLMISNYYPVAVNYDNDGGRGRIDTGNLPGFTMERGIYIAAFILAVLILLLGLVQIALSCLAPSKLYRVIEIRPLIRIGPGSNVTAASDFDNKPRKPKFVRAIAERYAANQQNK